MTIEATNVKSMAKLIKSDLWVSKKNMLKVVYENTLTMRISEGFRNMEFILSILMLRSCDKVNEEDIYLPVASQDITTVEPVECTWEIFSDTSLSKLSSENSDLIFDNLTFIVGDNVIPNLSTNKENNFIDNIDMTYGTELDSDDACPVELACSWVCANTKKKRENTTFLIVDIDLPGDNIYQTWGN